MSYFSFPYTHSTSAHCCIKRSRWALFWPRLGQGCSLYKQEPKRCCISYRRHAAHWLACRKHMSPVKQIMKASITSLCWSLAGLLPTADIFSCLARMVGMGFGACHKNLLREEPREQLHAHPAPKRAMEPAPGAGRGCKTLIFLPHTFLLSPRRGEDSTPSRGARRGGKENPKKNSFLSAPH